MTEIRFWTTILLTQLLAAMHGRWERLDERGGGRNTDEGWHIAGGAVVAGAIVAGITAFVASKLGALEE